MLKNYVDARTLTTMEAQTEALEKNTPFFWSCHARTKETICAIVEKKLDHTVAMTGDGVNDIFSHERSRL